MNPFRRVAWLLWLVGVAVGVPVAARGAFLDDGQDEVRARIAAVWGGFLSVECHSTEQVAGAAAGGGTSIDFAWEVEGRSSWSMTRPVADGIIHREAREDSRRRTSVTYFRTPPRSIDRVQIGPMRSEPGRYGGLMFPGLWMVLPGGKTVATLLDGGATLTNAGSARRPRWTVAATLPHTEIRCVLDEEHQDLPSELTVRSESRELAVRVDRFERAGDFWYPAAGTCVSTPVPSHLTRAAANPPTRVAASWRLDRVVFNRASAPQRFAWDDASPGAEVTNLLDNSSRTIGGKLARLKLLRDHPSPIPPAPAGAPIRVPAEEIGVRRWVQVSLLGVVVVCGGLALILRRRGADWSGARRSGRTGPFVSPWRFHVPGAFTLPGPARHESRTGLAGAAWRVRMRLRDARAR